MRTDRERLEKKEDIAREMRVKTLDRESFKEQITISSILLRKPSEIRAGKNPGRHEVISDLIVHGKYLFLFS